MNGTWASHQLVNAIPARICTAGRTHVHIATRESTHHHPPPPRRPLDTPPPRLRVGCNACPSQLEAQSPGADLADFKQSVLELENEMTEVETAVAMARTNEGKALAALQEAEQQLELAVDDPV